MEGPSSMRSARAILRSTLATSSSKECARASWTSAQGELQAAA